MKMSNQTLYDTMSEAATAAYAERPNRQTSIFHDYETGQYWYEGGIVGYSRISIGGREASFTHDRCAVIGPQGLTLCEPRLLPGDLVFSRGSIAKVVSVGDPAYRLYDEIYECYRGGKIPSFKKRLREEGYTVVKEDKEARYVVGRKVTT